MFTSILVNFLINYAIIIGNCKSLHKWITKIKIMWIMKIRSLSSLSQFLKYINHTKEILAWLKELLWSNLTIFLKNIKLISSSRDRTCRISEALNCEEQALLFSISLKRRRQEVLLQRALAIMLKALPTAVINLK